MIDPYMRLLVSRKAINPVANNSAQQKLRFKDNYFIIDTPGQGIYLRQNWGK